MCYGYNYVRTFILLSVNLELPPFFDWGGRSREKRFDLIRPTPLFFFFLLSFVFLLHPLFVVVVEVIRVALDEAFLVLGRIGGLDLA